MTDSNPRPTDYKSVALPTELIQHIEALSLFRAALTLYTKGSVRLYLLFAISSYHPFTTALRITACPSGWLIRYSEISPALRSTNHKQMATPRGLEPLTSSVTGWRANHLHHGAKWIQAVTGRYYPCLNFTEREKKEKNRV